MRNRLQQGLVFAGLVLAGLAQQASPSLAGFVSIQSTVGGSAVGGQTYANFDGLTVGSSSTVTTNGLTLTFAGGASVVQGSSPGAYAAPILSGNNNAFFESSTPQNQPDATPYITTSGGSVTMTFASGPVSYFGLLWGSIDSYNSITFNFADGTTQTLAGTAVGSAGTATTSYVNFFGSSLITSVTASSLNNSFEFDNVAYGNATIPEPASLVMLGLGAVVVGGVRFRATRARRQA